MAKKSSVDTLLGATDPQSLKVVALGSLLSFFVFTGSFVTTDSAMQVFLNTSPMSIATASESVVIPIEPQTQATGRTVPGTFAWEQQVARDGAARNPKRGCANADANCDGTISRDEWKAYIEKYRWYEEVVAECRRDAARCREIPQPPSFSLQLLMMSSNQYLNYLQNMSGIDTTGLNVRNDIISI